MPASKGGALTTNNFNVLDENGISPSFLFTTSSLAILYIMSASEVLQAAP